MRHNILTKFKAENVIGTEAWKRKQARKAIGPVCPPITDGLLGEIPDGLLALFLDVPDGRVARWRKEKGLRPCRHTRKRRRSTRPCSAKPTVPTVPFDVRVEMNHPGMIARLGHDRDSDIAAEFGVPLSTVWETREKLSISAYKPTLPDGCLEMLGQDSDAALAHKYGVPIYRVTAARNDRGISHARVQAMNWTDDTGTELVGVTTERRGSVVVTVNETRPRSYGIRPWHQQLCGFRRAPKPGCA